MCGIVGYVGPRAVQDVLLSGLEKLEYRGYDSAGISVLCDGSFDSVRSVGNLSALRSAIGDEAGEGGDLAERHAMEKLPQKLVNVRMADRAALAHATAASREAIEREAAALEGRGRVLVRPSGTEPLVRVMVEAPTEDETNAVCERLVAIVQGAASTA